MAGINQEQFVVNILSLRGGMNERERPWAIGGNQAEYIEGLDVSIDGIRKKLPGVRPYWGHAAPGHGMTTVRQPFHIGSARDIDDGIWTIHGSGVSGGCQLWIVRGNGESSQQPRSGGAPTQNWISGLSLNRFTHGYFKGFPGVYVSSAYQHPTDPTGGTNLFAISIEPPGSDEAQVHYSHNPNVRPAAVAWFQNRIWAAKNMRFLGQSFEDGSTLRWSVLGEGLNFSGVTNANSVRIEPGVGGDITALFAFRDNSPAMIVGKESAVFQFSPRWGSNSSLIPANADDLDTIESEIRLLSDGVGIIAQESVKHIPTRQGTDVIFLASDGHIRFLSRVDQDIAAGTGVPASWNIPDIVRRINLVEAHKAVAQVHGNCYYLAVPLDDATENSHLLCFNSIDGSWTIDALKVTALARVRSFGSDARKSEHLFLQYAESTADCSFTGSFTGYHIFRAYDKNRYRRPNGANISFEERSLAIHAGTMRHRKRWSQWVGMFEAETNATGQVTLSVSVDGGPYSAISSLTIPQRGASGESLHERRVSLEDVKPGFFLQYKITNSDTSRIGIVHASVISRVLNEEFDNTLT